MKAYRLLLLFLTFSALFPLLLPRVMAGEFDPLSSSEFNKALSLVKPAPSTPAMVSTGTLRSTTTPAATPANTPATETLLVERHMNQKGQTGRLADVYTYDYVSNETVVSVVDLATNQVLSTERKQKLQLPLTATELKRASDLIFADAEEKRLLSTEYKRITGKTLTSVAQLNVKAFVFDAESLPERLNPASQQCGVHRCAQVLLYTHESVVFEVSPIVNLSKGLVTQTIGF